MNAPQARRAPPPRARAWRWGVAGLSLLASVILRERLGRAIPGLPPYPLLFPAVAIAGTVTGTRAGLLVAGAGLLLADFLWLQPRFVLYPTNLADAAGMVTYVVACLGILAVTQALLATKNRLQAYFDVAEIMLVVIGLDRRIQAINQHGARVLGAGDPSELIGLDWFETFVPPESRQRRLADWTANIAAGAFAPYEAELLRRDSGRRLIAWHLTLLRDARGRKHAVIASGDDLTDTRATQAALRQSEVRLTNVLRQVPAAVAIIEAPDGRLALRSDRSTEVLGGDPTQLGQPARWSRYQGLHEDSTPLLPQEYPILRALQLGETVEGARFQYRKPDASLIDLEVYAAPIRNESGAILAAIGIAFDVSKRAGAERALRVSEMSLRQALHAREMLVREAHHRIKNSLQLVSSLLTMQQVHVTNPETADTLAAAIARVSAIAESHLALQNSLDLQTVDFATMLNEICRRLGVLSAAVSVSFSGPQGVMLDVDRAIPLALMVSELVTNALRHAYPIGRNGDVRVALTTAGDELRLQVADSGVGLPAHLERSGLGTRVITALATQTACTVETQSAPMRGTSVQLKLSLLAQAA